MNINKVANAFYEDAVPIDEISKHAKRAANRYIKKHGGLWVGGKISISNSYLVFSANKLNYFFHKELREINLPIKDISSVTYQFGWFTGIVVVKHKKGEFRFRCYGAKKIANEFNSYINKL